MNVLECIHNQISLLASYQSVPIGKQVNQAVKAPIPIGKTKKKNQAIKVIYTHRQKKTFIFSFLIPNFFKTQQ